MLYGNIRKVINSSNSSYPDEVVTLSRRYVEELINMREAINIVEKAFRLKAEGKVIMPPKLHMNLPSYHGDFRAMPSYIDGAVGIKWVSVYPGNREFGHPCVMATILLCDPTTGCPLVIMDGTYITKLRTGAAGGIAVKYLARNNASIIGVIGTGVQARTQLLGIYEVLPNINEVKAYDSNEQAIRAYAKEMGIKLNINIKLVATVDEAAKADILVTTTPSKVPIVGINNVTPGMHINAIGADANGKQELDARILKNAIIVVDDVEQACHSGEINIPLSQKIISTNDIYASLSEIVAGIKEGRKTDSEITIFDSTGLAILDIACAKFVYDKACKLGIITL
jgi:alanine dehydrogenase